MVQALVNAMIVLGSATLAVALNLLALASAQMAALVGGVVLLMLLQFHGAWRRRRERQRMQRDIANLKRHAREVARALDEAHDRIDQANAAIDEKTQAQSKHILSELKLLERLVRDFAVKAAEKQERPAPVEVVQSTHRGAPDAAPGFAPPDLLETIRLSLEENRIDLYLQPVVTLPQRKTRFYEALTRLRSEDGRVIMPAQYIRIATPAGLMSVVDNLLLFRCVQVMRRLIQKSREIGLFCNISADTLGDAEFFPQFLEFMRHNRDLAAHIVFEFAQSAVTNADARARENLNSLASLGFALSMDHVENLTVDFARLRGLGFRYIKVRADALTGGAINAAVAPEDLKRLLERNGLSLIAERVEEERTVVQLLDYNIEYAQGFLFGEPRPVREEQKTLSEPSPVVPLRRAANY